MELHDVEEILRMASSQGASTLLLVPGSPPVTRVAGKLQAPISTDCMTFHHTQQLAEQILDAAQTQLLNEQGSIELPFKMAGVSGTLTVFYGLGSHHMVFYIDTPSSVSPGVELDN